MIAIIDFGGQYVQNIRRVLMEKGFEARIVSCKVKVERLTEYDGIILSGGPYSLTLKEAPRIDRKILELGIPILGICYGHQLLGEMLGGKVVRGKGEYGFTEIKIRKKDKIFEGWKRKEICWMSHSDQVIGINCTILASTPKTQIASFRFEHVYGVQFHPEVMHTPKGHLLLENFAEICGCERKPFDPRIFVERALRELRERVRGKAVLAVSGGVDSTTLAFLSKKALGDRVLLVHIDTGLMRKNESKNIVEELSKYHSNIIFLKKNREFLKALKGVEDGERKRKIIGELFVRFFEDVAKEKGAEWLIQGTIAPDVIESTRGSSKTRGRHGGKIKTHHNVGGLPKDMRLKVVEPFRELFKYQVKEVAEFLGVPEEFRKRQPFPGPGLACRISGEVNEEKLEMLKDITEIVEGELERYNPSQYFAILVNGSFSWERIKGRKVFVLKDKAVGVKGDERVVGDIVGVLIRKGPWIRLLKLQSELTSDTNICRVFITHFRPKKGKFGVIIRAVDTKDFMTAIPTKINLDHLKRIERKLLRKFDLAFSGYEITTKPPATIELI